MLCKVLIIFVVLPSILQENAYRRVYITHMNTYISAPDDNELKINNIMEEFRRHNNGEIRSSDGSKCVDFNKEHKEIHLGECHESIKKFYYNKSRETYFTDYDVGNGHVKLCWKKTSDIIEAHECTSTTYGFSELAVTASLKTSEVTQSSTPPNPLTFIAATPSASLLYMNSSTNSVLAMAQNASSTHPSQNEVLSPFSTQMFKSTVAVSVTASLESAEATQSTMPSSLLTFIGGTPSASLTFIAGTPSASLLLMYRSTYSAIRQSAISSDLYTDITPSTSSIGIFSSAVSVSETFQSRANDLYLASPGEQCQEFCQRHGRFCSTSLATGNTDAVFSSQGVTCRDSETHKFWRQAYDPSYQLNGSICAGYMNINESEIKCSVNEFNSTNIRRLCKCIRSADEDKFTPWTPWSSCSLSCNGGIQSRKRVCNELSCTGPTTDSRACNAQPCPVDGGLSDWSTWSSCTVPCGRGQKRQTRTCTKPKPDHGGLDCYGDKERTDKCNSQFCPVHGNWTDWTEWSGCDKPCNDGRIKRWRYCTNPVPLYGGRACIGQATEEKQCNTQICPAENITVVGVRFEYHWNDSMQRKDSISFNKFVTDLQVNVGRLFQYSAVNSSYQRTAVNSLRKGSVISTFTLYFTGLDSFQTLLLQEAMENDKYIAKMKILDFNNTYKTAIVPASPPLNFTITPLSPTSIRAEWLDIPPSHRNGNISGYIMFYKEKLLRAQPYMSIATHKRNLILQGLRIYTEYTFRVLAYNENGNGIATPEQHVYTKESAPAAPPYNVTGKSPNGFTAIIEWIHISQYEWNGVPVGTIIVFDDGNGHIGNKTISFPTTSATLTDLVPSTTYVIDVCELTSPGPGPCQRLQIRTNPSPPSRSPENVTINDKTSHNQLGLSWNSITPAYVHGDLLGYKVLYTLTKIAGNAIVVQTTKVKTVHPSLNTVIITGLETNAQYFIQVLAFNAYGDGVSSKKYYGETCACPPVIHTNYAASAPYMYRDSSGKRQGLLVDILENATRYVCSACKRPTATIIDYVNNGKNGWAEKSSLADVKKDIDNYVEITFPAFGSTELTAYYGFPFTPVFSHPGVVYYIIKDSMNDQVVKMVKNVFNTWPIFLINILFVTISGYIVWAMEYSTDDSDFPNKCLPGVLNGMYWAFISMGTHGYGDLTPKGIASRMFAIIWILIGMVNLAIFTGALTTAITAAQVYNDPKMYGVEIAAVHDSASYRIAILRNAKVNTKANYKTIEDVSTALKQRQVRGALVDVFSAASRSDLFLQSDIVAKKSLEYPSAYGFVLSGDMKNAAPEFRRYLSSQADKILNFMKEKSAGLEVNNESGGTVSMFDPSSPILVRVLVAVSTSLAVLFCAGLCYHFYTTKKKREAVNPSEDHIGTDLMQLCEESLSQFEESVTKKLSKQFNDQLNERVNFLFNCKNPTILEWIPYFRLRKSVHEKVLFSNVTPGPCKTAWDVNENQK